METSLRIRYLLSLLFAGIVALSPVHAAYSGSQAQPPPLPDKKIVVNTGLATQAKAYQQALALKDQTIAILCQKVRQLEKMVTDKDTALQHLQRQLEQTEQTLNDLLAQQIPPKKEEAQEEQKEEPLAPPPDIREVLKTFEANLKKYNIQGGKWYRDTTGKEIAGLQAAYPRIKEAKWQREAALLAQEWATFPRIKGDNNLWTKYDYLAVKTVWLKRQLTAQAQSKLACTSEGRVDSAAQNYCWYHGPNQHLAQAPEEAILHTAQGTLDFDAYLRAFRQGLQAYDVRKQDHWSEHQYGWYAAWIEKEIQGLQKAYLKIQGKALKKEAERLACALAFCPRFEKFDLLFHFMAQQNGLLEFKLGVGDKIKKEIVHTRGDMIIKASFLKLGTW